jgi:hypothetical protein
MKWSASSVPRLLQCATSALLPHHDFSTQYAEAGREHHADVEAAIDVGDEDAIPPEILSLLRPGDETFTELAFAYDLETDTARDLGRISRDEYPQTGELCGKTDLVIRGNGRVVVVDHKGIEKVDDADRNTQVATYALMVARAWGFDEVDVVIRYRATWRRPSYATLNALDLAAHGDRLRQLRDDIARAREQPQLFLNDGPHCKYCPAFLGGCPRVEALQRRVANGELVRQAEAMIPFNDDDEAAFALDLLERIKTMKQRLEAALHARAAERPIPRGDGTVWGPRPKRGNRMLDGDAAYALLAERYGAEVAERAVTREATQKGIEAALKAAGVRGATARKDELVKALEDAGKVTRKTKTEYETYDPALALKDAG